MPPKTSSMPWSKATLSILAIGFVLASIGRSIRSMMEVLVQQENDSTEAVGSRGCDEDCQLIIEPQINSLPTTWKRTRCFRFLGPKKCMEDRISELYVSLYDTLKAHPGIDEEKALPGRSALGPNPEWDAFLESNPNIQKEEQLDDEMTETKEMFKAYLRQKLLGYYLPPHRGYLPQSHQLATKKCTIKQAKAICGSDEMPHCKAFTLKGYPPDFDAEVTIHFKSAWHGVHGKGWTSFRMDEQLPEVPAEPEVAEPVERYVYSGKCDSACVEQVERALNMQFESPHGEAEFAQCFGREKRKPNKSAEDAVKDCVWSCLSSLLNPPNDAFEGLRGKIEPIHTVASTPILLENVPLVVEEAKRLKAEGVASKPKHPYDDLQALVKTYLLKAITGATPIDQNTAVTSQ